MANRQLRKRIFWLVAVVVYIHTSGLMAHYYVETDLKKNPTTIDKILLQPLETVVSSFVSPSSPEHPKDGVERFVDRSIFYVFFFCWPILVLCALIYWVVLLCVFLAIVVSMVVSALLSAILWIVTYLLLGFKIF